MQIEEYAANRARDPLLELALKPAEQLTPDEKRIMLRNFFLANPSRMIQRYPRYRELFQAWEAQKHGGGWKGVFSTQDFRDLQVLSQARLVRRRDPGARLGRAQAHRKGPRLLAR